MSQVDPHGEPFTVAEVRKLVDKLMSAYHDAPGVELLGLVKMALDSTQCTCHSSIAPQATILRFPAKTLDTQPWKADS